MKPFKKKKGFPIIILLPNSVDVEDVGDAREYISKRLDSSGYPYLVGVNTKHEFDIIVPRFVGWFRYNKMKQEAIKGIKALGKLNEST